jgi:hypothetical protein
MRHVDHGATKRFAAAWNHPSQKLVSIGSESERYNAPLIVEMSKKHCAGAMNSAPCSGQMQRADSVASLQDNEWCVVVALDL